MEKKKLAIGAAILVVVSLVLSFVTTGISTSFKDNAVSEKEEKSILGEWVDSSGVDINFTNKGVFQMFGDDVATYQVDTKAKTITIKYAQTYGGQETKMSYTLEGSTLTMKDTATGDSRTYNRK